MKWLTRLLLRVRRNRASASAFYKKHEAIIRGSQSGAQQTHFFDVIPTEVLLLVLKYLSKRPFSERFWVRSVDVDDVKTVFQLGGTLTAASRETFKSLELGLFLDEPLSEESVYAFLVRIMAPQLESMVLSAPVCRKINYEQLGSLRKLSVSYNVRWKNLKRILVACGNALEELELHEEWWLKRKLVQTIACHCKSLKVFKTNAEFETTLEPIWEAVGNTLVEYSGCVPEHELAPIARHCTRLEKLDLTDIDELMMDSAEEVIDLLQALKALRVLNLTAHDYEYDGGLSIDQLRRLVGACPPNVKIHGYVSVGPEMDVANFIRGVGTHLQVLKLDYSFGTVPSELLPGLQNLKELELTPVDGYSDEMIQSVFVEPLPGLQKLSLSNMKASKMLGIVACAVTKLRELFCSFGSELDEYEEAEAEMDMEVEGRRAPVNAADFLELLRANAQLRYVAVEFGTAGEAWMKEITDFIPPLKVCGCLKHVKIKNEMLHDISEYEDFSNSGRLKEISDACVPLRNKSFSLSVNGVYYLPS